MTLKDLETQSQQVHDTFLKAYNTGDVDLIDEVCADDFVAYHTGVEGKIHGADAYKPRTQELRRAFPDFEMDLVETVFDAEMSAGRYRWSGTHENEFNGIPATGKGISVESLTMAKLDDDGKLAELWVFADTGSAMRQLGVTPGK